MYQSNPAWIECQKISKDVDELYQVLMQENDKEKRQVLYPIYHENIEKLNKLIPEAYKVPIGDFIIFNY